MKNRNGFDSVTCILIFLPCPIKNVRDFYGMNRIPFEMNNGDMCTTSSVTHPIMTLTTMLRVQIGFVTSNKNA